MSDLYTVRMKRKMIKTVYDAKGRGTETVTLLDETYTDLPGPTARMYKTKFPDAQVMIKVQAPSQDRRGSKSSVRFDGERGGTTRRTQLEGFAKAGTKPVGSVKRTLPEPAKPAPVMSAGDYADVVNKMTGAA